MTAADLTGRTIAIAGCGWLGLPLAQRLVQAGATVHGTTTSEQKLPVLQQSGIRPFRLRLEEEAEPVQSTLDSFLQADALVVAIPPRASEGDFTPYLQGLRQLNRAAEKAGVRQIVFISSTGVYPEGSGVVTEDAAAPHSPRAAVLLEAESIFKGSAVPAAIVRFGGLFGPGRHPGRFLSGRTGVPNPDAPVNMIHLDDCVQLLTELLVQKPRSAIWHACADEHPSREQFYTRAAALAGLPGPQFAAPADPPISHTLIRSTRLKEQLPYRFLHPDPLKALEELV